jgi:hypothetical protein
MKRKITRNGPSREPQGDSEIDWYYEGRRNFHFVHQIWINGDYVRTDTIRVSTRLLRKSIARCKPIKKP